MLRYFAQFLFLCGWVVLGTACTPQNRHGPQELPAVTRVDTSPSGATLLHVRRNLEWTTPCDFMEDGLEVDDDIVISKTGFQTFRGRIEDLRQIALGTYRLDLVPLGEVEK
jgi:hypothetical protein